VTTARVVAVVVTYHPDEEVLSRLLARLRPQAAHIVQVDNTDGLSPVTQALGPDTTLLRLGANAGIGQAQNLGIEKARRLGATHVLLLDQDSLPTANFVARQLHTLATEETGQVAAIGPICRDVKTSRIIPLIQRRGWRIRRVVPTDSRRPLSVAYMPASGSLIPMAMLDRVGAMRSDYFIDRVDVEWCLRAGRMGLQVWVDPGLEMAHDQGIQPIEVLGRTVYVGHEFRRYFHVRNSLAMALRAPIPLFWRIDKLIKTPGYVLFYSATARGSRLRMARLLLTAVADGLRGRMGKGYYEQRPF
jgi:rhamnosyltransferase